MTCPGGALDSSCFGLAACPDLSLCDITARTLLLDAGVPQTSLQVGSPGDNGMTTVEMGNINNVAPTYILQSINTYAQNSRFDSVTSTTISVTTGSISLIASGGAASNILNQASGQFLVTADRGISLTNVLNDISITNGGLNDNIIISAPAGNVQLLGTTITETTPTYSLQETAMNRWISTNPTLSLLCQAGTPTATAGRSVRVHADMVMEPGTRILSGETSAPNIGYVTVGGSGLNFCDGATIKTSGLINTITIQSNTTEDMLDIRATIKNNDPGQPLKIADDEGVDFMNTMLFNSQGNLEINDTLQVDIITDNGVGTIVLDSNVNITGTLNGQMIDGTGACCTASDERVKRNIKDLSQKESIGKIMALQPKKWEFTPDYLGYDKTLKNHTYEGLIAQELEQHIPQAVKKVKKTVGGITFEDFRHIDYLQIQGHLINSIKFLVGEIEALKAENAVLRREIGRMKIK